MKTSIKKDLFRLTVILMVTYMGIGFISCGSDDDNNSGGNETYFDGETVNVDSNGKLLTGIVSRKSTIPTSISTI